MSGDSREQGYNEDQRASQEVASLQSLNLQGGSC